MLIGFVAVLGSLTLVGCAALASAAYAEAAYAEAHKPAAPQDTLPKDPVARYAVCLTMADAAGKNGNWDTAKRLRLIALEIAEDEGLPTPEDAVSGDFVSPSGGVPELVDTLQAFHATTPQADFLRNQFIDTLKTEVRS